MNKLSETGRKILRAFFGGLGTAAVSLSFGACNWLFTPIMYGPAVEEYGMPPYYEEDVLITGIVKSKKTGEAIQGISVWIKDVTNYYLMLSSFDGSFSFYIPIKDNYTIIFTDIDGEEKGSFKPLTINLTKENVKATSESPLIVELEEIEKETEAGEE